VRRPTATLVAGLVIFGALAVASAGYVASGFGAAATAPAGSDSALGNAQLAEHFPQTAANPTIIVLRLRQPVWSETAAVAAAEEAVPAIRAATARAAQVAGASASGLTGQAAFTYDVAQLSDYDLRTVIPIAVAVIAVLLAVVMRSLIAPLYLIASVVPSYFSALGLTVLVFIKAAGQPGLTFILPFMLFMFLLALGEDYNILVMTRIREEAHHRPLREAVSRALSVTGTTVTSAGLVLAGTFGVLAVVGSHSAGQQNVRTIVDVGFGLGLGTLMDTFLVRTLLVPSVVVPIGRWNWRPASLCRLRPVAAPADRAPVPPSPQAAPLQCISYYLRWPSGGSRRI
jgi:uncharacterized membrane protein YdfJ with MMPL/SSD domain